MPVIDRRGHPLPDGHPFKGTQIVFGQKRSDSSATSSAGAPSVPLVDPNKPCDPNAPEAEADGYRAGALRVARWKHQNKEFARLKAEAQQRASKKKD